MVARARRPQGSVHVSRTRLKREGKNTENKTIDETYPSGTVLLGGGLTLLSNVSAAAGQTLPVIVSDGPVSNVTWEARVKNADPNTTIIYGLWIMCATVSP